MKKIILTLLMTAVVLQLLATAALAADTVVYRIPEKGMLVNLPTDFIVLTRDSEPGDVDFQTLGLDELTQRVLIDSFAANNIYLMVISSNWDFWITLSVADTENLDLNRYSDARLKSYAAGLTVDTVGESSKIERSIYESDQTAFIRIHAESEFKGVSYNSQAFLTILDGKQVTITVTPNSGEITSDMEWTLKQIVDGITFTEKVRSARMDFFEAGITFQKPAEWVEESISETEVQSIPFSCFNVFGNKILFRYEFLGYNESNRDYTLEQIREMFEEDGSPVSYSGYETINSLEFYKIIQMKTDLTVVSHVLIRDGEMYTFSFHRQVWDGSYLDYTGMLSTISFDVEPDGISQGVLVTPSILKPFVLPETAEGGRTLAIILSLLITIGIYALPAILVRYLIVRRPVPKAGLPTFTVGILAFIAAGVLLNYTGNYFPMVAVILWTGFNYRIFKGKKS